MAIRYTQEQIDYLNSLDIIKFAKHNRITFTFEFRTTLYEYWVTNPFPVSIRQCCFDHGFPKELNDIYFFKDKHRAFKKFGKPSYGKGDSVLKRSSNTEEEIKKLLESGYFYKSRNGIKFSDEFKEYIYSNYPNQSIETSLISVGLDPYIIGYERIRLLKCEFDDTSTTPRRTIYDDTTIEKYKHHPYIQYLSSKQIRFKTNLYNELSPLINNYPINELLEAYEIDPTLLSFSQRNNLKYKISKWKMKDAKKLKCSNQLISIQYNRMKLLDKCVNDGFNEIGNHIDSYSRKQKKELFEMISTLPKDPHKQYSIRYILSLIKVSKTHYYSVLKDKDYVARSERKKLKDLKDLEYIKTTMEYKGFDKGVRQIYMMMKSVTGIQFGMNKIRRLMKYGNLKCTIRKANHSRRSAQRLLKENRRDNLLKRQFKLFKPNEVTLTDVTYLSYGGGKRAYGSAALDPVTGKLKAFNISLVNDMGLVSETLNTLKQDNNVVNGILHSDQGALYLSPSFQQKVKDMKLTQSMSKRGNCWDNAPQESFFGHFKDECNIKICETLEELQEVVSKYVYYYNNERHIWTRNKMTPIEYETYLNNLSEEEYQLHLNKELKSYEQMKRKAEQDAILRASTLGV